jgi:hypothetical protein
MAVTVPDSDVRFATQGDASVSYQAGDWVVFLGILTGNSPTGSPTNITITSSGGGSMGIIFSSQFVQDRYVLATLKMTASGTTTWSFSTVGNVSLWLEKGAVVLRGVDTIALYDQLYQSNSAASETPDSDFDRTVDVVDSYGQIALMHGYGRHINSSSVDPILTFVDLSPASPFDTSYLDTTPGIGTSTNTAWVGTDLTFDQNYYLDPPGTTSTYTVTHHITHFASPNEAVPVGVITRFGVWPMVVVEIEEEPDFWGILTEAI